MTFYKILNICIILLTAIFLTACPYRSYYTINDGKEERVKKGLLGYWQSSDSSGLIRKVLISKAGKHQYKFFIAEADPYFDSEYNEFGGYTADIAGNDFLYVYPLKSDVAEYFYFKYKLNGDGTLTIWEVDDSRIRRMHEIQSGNQLRTLLDMMAKNPEYFIGKTSYVKLR